MKNPTKHLVEHPQHEMIIKSARIFEKDSVVHIDYRINLLYRKNGKERTRFSTGESATKRAKVRVERDKYALAQSHYLENVTLLDEANLVLGDIALDAINDGRGNRQDDTHNDYQMIYETYIKPIFEKSILREIRVTDIKSWKDALLKTHSMSKSRYSKFHFVLNTIFKYALENEMIDRNPASFVDKRSKLFAKPKKSLAEKYYTSEETKLMLEHATGWFRVMLLVYLNTGLRTGEGLALKWTDIDFVKNTIKIQRSMRKGKLKDGTKTGVDRIILLSKPLKEALLSYRDEGTSKEWLFPNVKTGKPYYEANSITRWYFKPLLKKLNIEYKTFYALRHTFASLSMENNIPMSVIQKQLGHKKLSTLLDFYIKHDLLKNSESQNVFDNLYA